jgi:threonine dehydrogenase-like Zn-dependent dehydrogenase
MKALYYPTWGRLEVREVPRPTLLEGEVLVRVSECGICGSELETFRTQSERRTPPLILGHEFCGSVEDAGSSRSGWAKGSRVVAHALIHCGQCAACIRGDTNLCRNRQLFGMHRPGGFGEYVAVPDRVLIAWPEGVPASTAVFAEPLSNGINALRQGPHARKSRVIVIGAGPIGLMCLSAAKHLYRSNVIISDLICERLDTARMLGADLTVNVEQQNLAQEARGHWGGEHAEFVVDAVGNESTKRLSLKLVEPGGTVVWLGLHEDLIRLNSYALTLEQRTVCGSYSGSFEDFRKAAQLLASGVLDTSWATRYALGDGEAGFSDMLLGTGNNIKGILQLDERPHSLRNHS